MSMEMVKVVIPVYREELPIREQAYLRNNIAKLSSYPVVFVCPRNLDTSRISEMCQGIEVVFERFDDDYFTGISGYNRLMLSTEFYSRFSDTGYILICQTDAFVFHNALSDWIKRGYDYVGGPWIASPEGALLKFVNAILHAVKLKKKKDRSHIFRVGNGGFSLRRVAAFVEIASEHRNFIDMLENSAENNRFSTEDLFWSIKAPELQPSFRIPDYTEALDFAMDRRPARALRLNGGRLPFGCHGLNKEEILKFWTPIINPLLK